MRLALSSYFIRNSVDHLAPCFRHLPLTHTPHHTPSHTHSAGAIVITLNNKLLGGTLYVVRRLGILPLPVAHLPSPVPCPPPLIAISPTSSFFQGLCVLGYCMLPLVLACILLRFVGYLTTHLAIRLVFVAAAFGWSIFGENGDCKQTSTKPILTLHAQRATHPALTQSHSMSLFPSLPGFCGEHQPPESAGACRLPDCPLLLCPCLARPQ